MALHTQTEQRNQVEYIQSCLRKVLPDIDIEFETQYLNPGSCDILIKAVNKISTVRWSTVSGPPDLIKKKCEGIVFKIYEGICSELFRIRIKTTNQWTPQ